MFLKSGADKSAFFYIEYLKAFSPSGFQLFQARIEKDVCLILTTYKNNNQKWLFSARARLNACYLRLAVKPLESNLIR